MVCKSDEKVRDHYCGIKKGWIEYIDAHYFIFYFLS